MPTAPRLTVGIVGAGRAGAVLGAALARVGHQVLAVSGSSPASLRRAGQLLPRARVVRPHEVLRSAQLILLAVPDDALPGLVADLAEPAGTVRGRLVVHLSGRHGLGVLEPLTRQGGLPLAVHPVMTLTGSAADLPRLAGAVFGVTAPDALRPVAQALVAELEGEVAWVAEPDRALYHAALAGAANHVAALVGDAAELLRTAGVGEPARALRPLVEAAVEHALADGDSALTGPAARGDAGTVAAHLSALADRAPDQRPAYLALARRTADRALAAGLLAPGPAGPLLDVLADPGPVS